jgi:hypothetical protein
MFKLLALGLLSSAGVTVKLAAAAGGYPRRHTPRGPIATTDLKALRGGEMRRVLDGQHFAGQAGRAYRAAAEIPDVLDHLYCYCECEPAIGHKSLKSCFVDLHGANCGICQQQAIMAWRLNKRQLPILQIRQKVDQAFSKRL